MEIKKKEWIAFSKELNELPLNDLSFIETALFKYIIVSPLDRNTKVCQDEIDSILHMFKDLNDLKNISILEVGAGYGNLCRNLHKRLSIKNYTILDIPEMQRFSKYFLKSHNINCNFVESENIEELFDKKFDLFISTICLSEIPDDFKDKIAENLFPICDKLFIVDSNNKRFSNWLINKTTHNFNTLNFAEFSSACYQPNHSAYFVETI